MNVSRTHRSVVVGLALALWCLPGPSAAEGAGGLEIGFVNGAYENLDTAPQPIRQGGVTIRLSSPEHRFTVHGNRLTLAANGDGTVDAAMEVDFEGGGQLIADVESIGRFEDRVAVPRQTARAAGTLRLARDADSYLFTIVTADPSVRLTIHSGLAGQVVGACRVFALLMSLPCDGLEQSLAAVHVPIPGPGEQVRVRADLLSDEERGFLDRFVAAE